MNLHSYGQICALKTLGVYYPSNTKTASGVVDTLKGVGHAIGDAAGVIPPVIKPNNAIADHLTNAFESARGAVGKVRDAGSAALGKVPEAVKPVSEALGGAGEKLRGFANAAEAHANLAPDIQRGISAVKPFVPDSVGEYVNAAQQGVGAGGRALDTVSELAGHGGRVVKGLGTGVQDIGSVAQQLSALGAGAEGASGAELLSALRNAIGNQADTVGSVRDLADTVGAAAPGIRNAVSGLRPHLPESMHGGVDFVTDALSKLRQNASDFSGKLPEVEDAMRVLGGRPAAATERNIAKDVSSAEPAAAATAKAAPAAAPAAQAAEDAQLQKYMVGGAAGLTGLGLGAALGNRPDDRRY